MIIKKATAVNPTHFPDLETEDPRLFDGR